MWRRAYWMSALEFSTSTSRNTRNDNALVRQKRWGLSCIDRRAQFVFLAIELVDHHRPVAVTDEIRDQVARGGTQQDLVVTGQ